MVIRYQTNEDGEAVVSGFQDITILRVTLSNRTTNNPTVPPYLRSKEFSLMYDWRGTYDQIFGTSFGSDTLVPFINSFSGPVLFFPPLDTPDYQDPEW